MRNTFKLLVVIVGVVLLANGTTAQETVTPNTDSPMHEMASGQGMMGQGGMMPMMRMMGPMMEQCTEMMAAMTEQMRSAPNSQDDKG